MSWAEMTNSGRTALAGLLSGDALPVQEAIAMARTGVAEMNRENAARAAATA
jgi:hypothetical protein